MVSNDFTKFSTTEFYCYLIWTFHRCVLKWYPNDNVLEVRRNCWHCPTWYRAQARGDFSFALYLVYTHNQLLSALVLYFGTNLLVEEVIDEIPRLAHDWVVSSRSIICSWTKGGMGLTFSWVPEQLRSPHRWCIRRGHITDDDDLVWNEPWNFVISYRSIYQ